MNHCILKADVFQFDLVFEKEPVCDVYVYRTRIKECILIPVENKHPFEEHAVEECKVYMLDPNSCIKIVRNCFCSLVNEEIFGVHSYVADICRRLAKLGYLAVATEYYARIADLSTMTDAGTIFREVISKAPDAQYMDDLDATAAWAAANKGDPARMGVIGFCRGGRQTWLYAAHNPKLKAAVAFYGPLGGQPTPIQPVSALDVADRIDCPLLGLYGGADPGIPVELVHQAEAKAKAAHKTVEIVIYPDVGHAFHADYRPSYRKDAAEDGWKRALAWFRRYGVAPAA